MALLLDRSRSIGKLSLQRLLVIVCNSVNLKMMCVSKSDCPYTMIHESGLIYFIKAVPSVVLIVRRSERVFMVFQLQMMKQKYLFGPKNVGH